MIIQIQPLVVTPLPMPGESLMGLILRTSEVNGYESPSMILRYAGLSENEIRSVRPPLDKLSQLYARKLVEFSPVAGSTLVKNKTGRRQWQVMNHLIPSSCINIKSAKICPECILENHHVDGFWDLKHAMVCPAHKRAVISVCPKCNKQLSWHRQGLLTCSCGHDLSELRGSLIEDNSILNIMELIKGKLQGNILHNSRLIDAGFPLEELNNISLSTLLRIINRFEQGSKRKTIFNVQHGVPPELNALKIASGFLGRWPHGLYDYLENLPKDTRHANKATSFNLHSQFHRFYGSFFRSGFPENEIAFLRKAFVSFGNERWQKNGFIDIRVSNRVETSRNIVGISGLAKYLGVMPPTAIKYVKDGLIKGEPLTSGSRTRKIFDLTKDVPFKPCKGARYNLRDAAKFLCISVKLLQLLKKEKIYKMVHLAYGLDGYCEVDLIEFRDQIVNLAPLFDGSDLDEHIYMNSIMRKKKCGAEVYAAILSAVINKQITPVGRTGNEIGDLMFNKAEVLNILR